HRAGMNLHHPVGTCRMGEDPMAVVDPRLRGRGVARLRVVDASGVATVAAGHTQAPSIIVGEEGGGVERAGAWGGLKRNPTERSKQYCGLRWSERPWPAKHLATPRRFSGR